MPIVQGKVTGKFRGKRSTASSSVPLAPKEPKVVNILIVCKHVTMKRAIQTKVVRKLKPGWYYLYREPNLQLSVTTESLSLFTMS
jgi:hypothetical protein